MFYRIYNDIVHDLLKQNNSTRQIKQIEGIQGYFKGLGPNLVGVIPAR